MLSVDMVVFDCEDDKKSLAPRQRGMVPLISAGLDAVDCIIMYLVATVLTNQGGRKPSSGLVLTLFWWERTMNGIRRQCRVLCTIDGGIAYERIGMERGAWPRWCGVALLNGAWYARYCFIHSRGEGQARPGQTPSRVQTPCMIRWEN